MNLFFSPAEDQAASAFYNEQAADRALWLTQVFDRSPAALLLDGYLSVTSVSLVLEQQLHLTEEAATQEAIEWLDAPSEAQIALMNAEDANDARVTIYERRRYNGELDEEE